MPPRGTVAATTTSTGRSDIFAVASMQRSGTRVQPMPTF
jgi:hypothetical protein